MKTIISSWFKLCMFNITFYYKPELQQITIMIQALWLILEWYFNKKENKH